MIGSHIDMKHGQFITLMSESLGIEDKTIKMIVRVLREAGLFTTGARGVNAPDITSRDAARVILAAIGSPSPSRAEKDVRYFSALKPEPSGVWTDNLDGSGLWPDKSLEEVLIDCLENKIPYELTHSAIIRLSERGEAAIWGEDWGQAYHQREQWQAYKAEYSGANDKPKNKAVLDNWEAMKRIASTKINRSAEFPLEDVRQIGFEMFGWEVD